MFEITNSEIINGNLFQ